MQAYKVGKGIVITFSRTYDFQLKSRKNVTTNFNKYDIKIRSKNQIINRYLLVSVALRTRRKRLFSPAIACKFRSRLSRHL